jgi:hypothetical protein
MLLERVSSLKLSEAEIALRRAARRRRASVTAVDTLGAATVFTIQQPDLYGMLLAADRRFGAFLPCRIAAYAEGEVVRLAAMSPVEFARACQRPDLDTLVIQLESLLTQVLEEATRPLTTAAGAQGRPESGWGATEDQVSMRGTLPQRIDKKGSKLAEMAGTGEHDSPGG